MSSPIATAAMSASSRAWSLPRWRGSTRGVAGGGDGKEAELCHRPMPHLRPIPIIMCIIWGGNGAGVRCLIAIARAMPLCRTLGRRVGGGVTATEGWYAMAGRAAGRMERK